MTKDFNWKHIAKLLLTSRYIDEVEEQELVPQKKVTYQFSAKGHELAQILLSSLINNKHDGASVYYRSRPFVLTQGLTIEEALASSMAKSKSISGGRDIGVVFNMHSRGKATILPTSGDVGSQYTPAVGWAQAIQYYQKVLKQKDWNNNEKKRVIIIFYEHRSSNKIEGTQSDFKTKLRNVTVGQVMNIYLFFSYVVS